MLTGLFQLQRRKEDMRKSLKGEILLADSYTRHVAELENMDLCSQARVCLLT